MMRIASYLGDTRADYTRAELTLASSSGVALAYVAFCSWAAASFASSRCTADSSGAGSLPELPCAHAACLAGSRAWPSSASALHRATTTITVLSHQGDRL